MEQISTDRLRRIAKRLTAAAAEYAEIADQMAANGISSIEVAGFATLENATLPRTESPANSARRALKVSLFAQPGVTPASRLDEQDSDEVELNKSIEAAQRKHASKRVEPKSSARKKKA